MRHLFLLAAVSLGIAQNLWGADPIYLPPIGRKILMHHLAASSLTPLKPEELQSADFLTARDKEALRETQVSRYEFRKTGDGVHLFTFHYPSGMTGFSIVLNPSKPKPKAGEDPEQGSDDLEADKKLMWQTEPLAGGKEMASTPRAIWAASRVFNSVVLTGKTRKQVIAELGDPKTSNNSKYNFPFWPVPKGTLVYRFDSGAYGWQFNVLFDKQDKVSRVERKWIH